MSKYILDPADLIYTGMGYHGGRKKARYSRANALTGAERVLRHRPTGIEVRGSIPLGHYTRKQMNALEQKLYQELYTALEAAVAKAHKVPGR